MKNPIDEIIIGSENAESAIERLHKLEKKVDFLIWAIRQQAMARAVMRAVSGETTPEEPTIH